MELVIMTPAEAFLKSVDFNHEEIKSELALRLEKYKGLQYTDDQIKEAKADRATLNKFVTAIDDKRKEIKKLCLEPYDKFEVKVKEIIKLVDEPASEIDKQVKSYEDKQREDKRNTIEGVYSESIGTLGDILPLKRLWNDKWLNATYKLSEVTKEISEAVENTKKDLEVIGNLNSEFDLHVKDKYLATGNLSEALGEKTRLEEQKKKMEEFKLKEEQRKRMEAEVEAQKQKLNAVRATIQTEPVQVDMLEVARAEIASFRAQEPVKEVEIQLEMLEFRVWVTEEQKQALRNCIIENKIKCGKV